MGYPLSKLVNQVRSQTDRINDPTLETWEIYNFLTDGGCNLVDLFNRSAPHWLQAHHEFTLTGNTFDTSVADLPTEFELDLGLDWMNAPGSQGRPVTIKRLPTFQDRNNLTNVNPLFPGGNYWTRNYEAQGDEIRVYAPNNMSAGDYRLWYKRRFKELDAPLTTVIEVEVGDQAQDPGGGGLMRIALANGGFEASDVGGSLTVTWDTPNEIYGGTFEIIQVLSPTFVEVDVTWPGGSFTNPAAGTASKTVQPADTQPDLPNVWTQFRRYIVTQACISVRMKFEEQIGELQDRLIMEERRCLAMAERRDSDLAQIPVLGTTGQDTVLFDNGDNGDGY